MLSEVLNRVANLAKESQGFMSCTEEVISHYDKITERINLT